MVIKTVEKIKLGIKKILWRYRMAKHKRALKRAEKYYLKEQDLEEHEGAFINKVYKNLQRHKQIDEEDPDVSPIKRDFQFDDQSWNDQQSRIPSSPTKISLNNTTSNLIMKSQEFDSPDNFTQIKQSPVKNGIMKSIFSFFQNRTAASKEPLEFQEQISQIGFQQPNIHNPLQQSLELEDNIDNSSAPGSALQSTKHFLQQQNMNGSSSIMSFDQESVDQQDEMLDQQSQNAYNTSNTLAGMNQNQDHNDEESVDDETQNAPPLQQQISKVSKPIFSNIFEQLQQQNIDSQSNFDEDLDIDEQEDLPDQTLNNQDLEDEILNQDEENLINDELNQIDGFNDE